MAVNTAIAIVVAAVMGACATPLRQTAVPDGRRPGPSVQLVSQGWHAGIVIRRRDIPAGIWPERNDFPDAEYLEVGWGDRDYYQTPDAGLGMLLKAALLPSESVLHVVGFRGSAAEYFPGKDIVRLRLSREGFERLCRYIHDSYSRDRNGGRVQPLGPSLHGEGRFYPSRDTYHLFNTCNVWMARALRAAGCPITPAFSITVDQLMSRAARLRCDDMKME